MDWVWLLDLECVVPQVWVTYQRTNINQLERLIDDKRQTQGKVLDPFIQR